MAEEHLRFSQAPELAGEVKVQRTDADIASDVGSRIDLARPGGD